MRLGLGPEASYSLFPACRHRGNGCTVTDHDLIAGIVTEYGIARPPYSESLKEIFRKKAAKAKEGSAC